MSMSLALALALTYLRSGLPSPFPLVPPDPFLAQTRLVLAPRRSVTLDLGPDPLLRLAHRFRHDRPRRRPRCRRLHLLQ